MRDHSSLYRHKCIADKGGLEREARCFSVYQQQSNTRLVAALGLTACSYGPSSHLHLRSCSMLQTRDDAAVPLRNPSISVQRPCDFPRPNPREGIVNFNVRRLNCGQHWLGMCVAFPALSCRAASIHFDPSGYPPASWPSPRDYVCLSSARYVHHVT